MEYTYINGILRHLGYDFAITSFGYYQIRGAGFYPYTDFTSENILDYKEELTHLFSTLKIKHTSRTIVLPDDKIIIALWVDLG